MTAPVNTDEKKIPQEELVATQKTDIALTEKKEDAPEDQNFVAFREARKREREKLRQEQEARVAADQRAREKEAEAAALKAAMEALLAKNQQQQTNYFDQPDESEEDRIEKKVQEALAKREAQAQREREQREAHEYPQRLQQTYPDFNQAISSENLDYLEYHYPEVAGPLSRLPDGYQKWQDIYKAVKKFVPNSLTAQREAKKAENNFSKPKSMSSLGATQNAESMASARLTEDRKAANWERMQRALKGLS